MIELWEALYAFGCAVFAAAGAYYGVKTKLAIVEREAQAAAREAQRAHERLDELLYRRM